MFTATSLSLVISTVVDIIYSWLPLPKSWRFMFVDSDVSHTESEDTEPSGDNKISLLSSPSNTLFQNHKGTPILPPPTFPSFNSSKQTTLKFDPAEIPNSFSSFSLIHPSKTHSFFSTNPIKDFAATISPQHPTSSSSTWKAPKDIFFGLPNPSCGKTASTQSRSYAMPKSKTGKSMKPVSTLLTTSPQIDSSQIIDKDPSLFTFTKSPSSDLNWLSLSLKKNASDYSHQKDKPVAEGPKILYIPPNPPTYSQDGTLPPFTFKNIKSTKPPPKEFLSPPFFTKFTSITPPKSSKVDKACQTISFKKGSHFPSYIPRLKTTTLSRFPREGKYLKKETFSTSLNSEAFTAEFFQNQPLKQPAIDYCFNDPPNSLKSEKENSIYEPLFKFNPDNLPKYREKDIQPFQFSMDPLFDFGEVGEAKKKFQRPVLITEDTTLPSLNNLSHNMQMEFPISPQKKNIKQPSIGKCSKEILIKDEDDPKGLLQLEKSLLTISGKLNDKKMKRKKKGKQGKSGESLDSSCCSCSPTNKNSSPIAHVSFWDLPFSTSEEYICIYCEYERYYGKPFPLLRFRRNKQENIHIPNAESNPIN